jgi:hypothetical protein
MMKNSIVYAVTMIAFAVGRPVPPEPSIGVSVFAAGQPEAPLQVDGFQQTATPLRRMKILVRNVTDKAISGFVIAAAVRTGCSVKSDAPTIYVGSVLEPTAVGPHSTVASKESVANVALSIVRKGEIKAGYFHVQVGVLEVRFADGTTWENKFPDASGLFDPLLMQSEAGKCAGWPTPASALDQLKITGVVGDPSWGSLEIRPKGYFVTCTIKENTAFCPTY